MFVGFGVFFCVCCPCRRWPSPARAHVPLRLRPRRMRFASLPLPLSLQHSHGKIRTADSLGCFLFRMLCSVSSVSGRFSGERSDGGHEVKRGQVCVLLGGMERRGLSSDFWGSAPEELVCSLNPKP